ncbi:MAG: energy-coupling factor transporter transmembrane component T [Clostridia bacterium]
MDKLNSRNNIYPILGFFVAVLTLVIGLTFVKNENILYFFIAVYVLHFVFGNWRACLAVIPFLVLMASFFGFVTYIVAQDINSTSYAVYRSFAVCLAVIPGLSTPVTAFVKNLRQLKLPKSITLGMMINLNFVPLFKKEMKQIHDAMKTRGVVSVLNPKVLYRAFLIPLIIRIINISETLSLSVETRGFTLEKSLTTVYNPIKFKTRDLVFIILFVIVGMGVFLL